VIDGADTFNYSYGDQIETLRFIAQQGPAYGVHVVMTMRGWNSGGMTKFYETFKAIYELKIADPTESKMGSYVAQEVPDVPGRGLIAAGGTGQARRDPAVAGNIKTIPAPCALHVLFAEPIVTAADGQVLEGPALCTYVNGLRPGHVGARAVPALPGSVALDDLVPAPAGGLQLGLREVDESVQLWSPDVDGHLCVLGESSCGKSTTLRTLLFQLQDRIDRAPEGAKPVVVVFDLRQDLLGACPSADRYVYHVGQIAEAVQFVRELLATRNVDETQTQEQLMARRHEGAAWNGPEVFVVIDHYSDLVSGHDDPLANLEKAAERGRQVGVRFIVGRTAEQGVWETSRGVLAGLRKSGAPVLLMSADPGLVNLVGRTRGQKLPAGRGLLICRDDRMMIQVAH
jgi:DNA segregation ATPase FtsK/SpoIIIE, S-DNA-T family